MDEHVDGNDLEEHPNMFEEHFMQKFKQLQMHFFLSLFFFFFANVSTVEHFRASVPERVTDEKFAFEGVSAKCLPV